MLTGGVSAFAVLLFALAGCSGADTVTSEKADPTVQQQDAATLIPQSLKKIQSESFRFTSTMTMDDVEIKGSGAFDMASKVGLVKLDMGAATGQDMKLEMRVLGDDMYMSGFFGTEQWIRLDLTKFPAGNMFGEAANPVGNADYLLAVSDDVKEVGRGRYQGTLDLKKYLDEYASPEKARKLEDALGKLGPEAMKVPFEATLDDQNRLTAMKITMTFDAGSKKMTMVQEAKYFDFGTKVDVSKPPADRVTDAPADLYKTN
jgi:hypothetical protein